MALSKIIEIIIAIVIFLFIIFLIKVFWNTFNYEGRTTCKFAYTFTTPFSWFISQAEAVTGALETAATITTYATTAFTVACLAVGAYKAARAAKGAYEMAKFGAGIKFVFEGVPTSKKTLFKEALKAGLNAFAESKSIKVLKTFGKYAGKAVRRTWPFLIGGAGGYVSLKFLISIFRDIIGNSLKMCQPEVIATSYKLLSVDCKELKNNLLPEVYSTLSSIYGPCTDNKDWKNIYLQYIISKYARDALGESLYGIRTGVFHLHYALILLNLSSDFEMSEKDVVCWWRLLKSKGKVSFYEKIYGKKGKELINSNDISLNDICKKVLDKLYIKEEDLFTTDEQSPNAYNYLCAFPEDNKVISGNVADMYLVYIAYSGAGGICILPINKAKT